MLVFAMSGKGNEPGRKRGEERDGERRETLEVLQEGARRELEDKCSYLEHTPNTGYFFSEKPKLNTVELTVC